MAAACGYARVLMRMNQINRACARGMSSGTSGSLTVRAKGPKSISSWCEAAGLPVAVGGSGRLSSPTLRGTTYSTLDSLLVRTPLRTRATGVALRPGGARLQLGPAAVTLGLDRLGLGPEREPQAHEEQQGADDIEGVAGTDPAQDPWPASERRRHGRSTDVVEG